MKKTLKFGRNRTRSARETDFVFETSNDFSRGRDKGVGRLVCDFVDGFARVLAASGHLKNATRRTATLYVFRSVGRWDFGSSHTRPVAASWASGFLPEPGRMNTERTGRVWTDIVSLSYKFHHTTSVVRKISVFTSGPRCMMCTVRKWSNVSIADLYIENPERMCVCVIGHQMRSFITNYQRDAGEGALTTWARKK